MTKHLFVYGSLCRQADGSLHPLLSEESEYLCDAHLSGVLYEIDGYPGAIILPEQTESKLYGELYLLYYPQRLLMCLDDYEECSASFSEPHEYRRIVKTVTTETGETVKAWIYAYNHSITGRRRIPSGDYRRFKSQDKPS